MRGLALLFTLHFGREPGRQPRDTARDPWFAADKAKHFFTSAFIQTASFSALRLTGASRSTSLIGATIATSAVGIGKELYDKKYGGDPSLKDLAWDGAGIVAASLLLRHTEP